MGENLRVFLQSLSGLPRLAAGTSRAMLASGRMPESRGLVATRNETAAVPLVERSPDAHSVPGPAAPSASDALVLDAGLRQSLVAVRSLGRSGLSVAALGASADAPAFASRWCAHHAICADAEGSDRYGDYLEHLLAHAGASVVIPSADSTIDLLRR